MQRFAVDICRQVGYNARMKTFFFTLLGLLCSTGILSAQQETPSAVPQEPNTAQEPEMMRDSDYGQVIVTCTIDDVPMRLLLDTGATHTVVDRSVAAEKLPNAFKLDTSGMQITGNAEGLKPEILVVKFGVAGKTRSQHPVLSMPLDGVRAMLKHPVDGILGMDVLCHLPFTLDFREGGESHWGADEDGNIHPLQAHRDRGGCPLVSLRIGEKVLENVLLDSGSTTTILPPDAWEAGIGETHNATIADVNGRREVSIHFGKPAPVELAPGLVREIAPQLQDGMNRSSAAAILGIESLIGLRLVYHPELGFSLLSDPVTR